MNPEAATPEQDQVAFSIFRETFLAILDPEGASRCREFGEVLGERFLGSASEEELRGIPFTVTEFQGAVRDLGFLVGFLERMGKERDLSELTSTERDLARIAEGAARELRKIASRIGSAFERATRDLPE